MRPLTTHDVPIPSWLDLSQAPTRLHAAVSDAVEIDRGLMGADVFSTVSFSRTWSDRFGYTMIPTLAECQTVLSNLPYVSVSLKYPSRWQFISTYPHQPPAIISMNAAQTAIVNTVREHRARGVVLGPPTSQAPPAANQGTATPNLGQFIQNAGKLIDFLEPIVKEITPILPPNVSPYAVAIDQLLLMVEKFAPAASAPAAQSAADHMGVD